MTRRRRWLNYDFTGRAGAGGEGGGRRREGFPKSRLHLLVPVFEEGTVDNDLLNEGTFNMKDYLQQQGYFDAVVGVR